MTFIFPKFVADDIIENMMKSKGWKATRDKNKEDLIQKTLHGLTYKKKGGLRAKLIMPSSKSEEYEILMGTPEFAVASLDTLINAGCNIVGVVTAPDKQAGRGMQLQQSAVKKYAAESLVNTTKQKKCEKKLLKSLVY